TMAMVRAPAARADLVAATRSGLRPDCEITMNSAWRSIKGVRNAVITEGALAETGRRSRVSTKYLRRTPACPELPRPHTTHRGAERMPIRCAMSCVAARLRTILATTSALSPISLAIADVVTIRPLRLAWASLRSVDAGHDPCHDPSLDLWQARQRHAEDCRHTPLEQPRHRPCRHRAP